MPIPVHAKAAKIDRVKARDALTVLDPTLSDVTDAELDAALTGIDQDALYEAHRANMTVEVWDRTSPINGVPAQHFLDRDDVDENGTDDIYLLIDQNGQVFCFQPHEPEVQGIVRVPKGQGKTRGGKHADQIAANHSAGEVLNKVREKIAQKRKSQ